MSNPTIVSIASGTTYTFYTTQQPTVTATSYTFPAGTNGYLLATDSSGNTTVTVIGTAQKPVNVFGKRRFNYTIAAGDTPNQCVVNGTTITKGGFVWLSQPECFASIDNQLVRIEMATNGYYCINYEVLFCIQNVTLNPSIQIATNSDGTRFIPVPSNYTTIRHGGYIETPGNMLTVDPSNSGNLLIDPNANVCELFYIELADGTFTNVEMPTLVVPPVSIVNTFSGVWNLLYGFRCQATQMPSINSTIPTVELLVTRYNQQSDTINVSINWLTPMQKKVYEFFLEAKHPLQVTSIDFSKILILKSVSGAAPAVVNFTQWYTSLPCVFTDGTTGTITVYRELLQVTFTTASAIRFTAGEPLGPFQSDGVYMVNGAVYNTDASDATFSATFDEKNLTITPQKGMTSFATFDSSKLWTTTPTKSAIVFDPTYTYFITVAQKTEVDLTAFGDYDSTDTFTYYAGTKGGSDYKDLPKGTYKVKPKDNIPSGTVIDTPKITATAEDGSTYSFSVSFTYEEFSRASFIVQGSQQFSTPYTRRGSFSGSLNSKPNVTGFWTYGPFSAQLGSPIHAYQNTVTQTSSSSNIYPVIVFSDPAIGTINETAGSLPITAQVLDEDMSIPAGPTDVFVRLNPCTGVQYSGGSYTIPKTAGVSFFRLGQNIYLLRSPPPKVKFDPASGNSSPTSASVSPSPPAPKSAPTTFIQTGAFAPTPNTSGSANQSPPASSVPSAAPAVAPNTSLPTIPQQVRRIPGQPTPSQTAAAVTKTIQQTVYKMPTRIPQPTASSTTPTTSSTPQSTVKSSSSQGPVIPSRHPGGQPLVVSATPQVVGSPKGSKKVSSQVKVSHLHA